MLQFLFLTNSLDVLLITSFPSRNSFRFGRRESLEPFNTLAARNLVHNLLVGDFRSTRLISTANEFGAETGNRPYFHRSFCAFFSQVRTSMLLFGMFSYFVALSRAIESVERIFRTSLWASYEVLDAMFTNLLLRGRLRCSVATHFR